MDPAPQLKAEIVRLDSKSGFQTHKVTRGAPKPPRPQKSRERRTKVWFRGSASLGSAASVNCPAYGDSQVFTGDRVGHRVRFNSLQQYNRFKLDFPNQIASNCVSKKVIEKGDFVRFISRKSTSFSQ